MDFISIRLSKIRVTGRFYRTDSLSEFICRYLCSSSFLYQFTFWFSFRPFRKWNHTCSFRNVPCYTRFWHIKGTTIGTQWLSDACFQSKRNTRTWALWDQTRDPPSLASCVIQRQAARCSKEITPVGGIPSAYPSTTGIQRPPASEPPEVPPSHHGFCLSWIYYWPISLGWPRVLKLWDRGIERSFSSFPKPSSIHYTAIISW